MDHHDTEAILERYLSSGSTDSGSRSDSHAHAITFVKIGGEMWSLMYSHLLWVYFSPSLGLRIQFSTHCISIEGHRLATLADSIVQRCAVVVKEVDERYADTESDDKPVVTAIHPLANNGRSKPFALPEGVTVQPDPE